MYESTDHPDLRPDSPPPPPPSTSPHVPYRATDRAATVVTWALRASIAAFLGVAAISLYRLMLTGQMLSTDLVASDRALLRYDSMVGLIRGLFVAALVAVVIGGIAHLVWFRRSYRNLTALGASPLRFGPAWAVGAWFVPILNLFRPKQIMDDIWRGSEAAASGSLKGWRVGIVPGRVHAWWAIVIVSSVLGRLARSSSADAATFEQFVGQLRTDGIVVLLNALLLSTAAVLLVGIVREVTRMQGKAAAATGINVVNR